MEHPISPKSTEGFSLIEVLVAVAVLAVLAAGVSLSVGRAGAKSETDQALFQRNFDTLRQLAITGAQTRGIQVSPKGMQLATRTEAGWEVSERIMAWRGQVTAVTESPSASASTPDLVLLANGESTAFAIVFSDGSDVRRCGSDGYTGLTCD